MFIGPSGSYGYLSDRYSQTANDFRSDLARIGKDEKFVPGRRTDGHEIVPSVRSGDL